MSGPDILCLGEPLIEFVAQEDGRYLRGFGGDTSNAAIAAARQGASVGYITALGQDQFGDALIELWSREGVDASMVRRAEAPTGVYFVDPDPAERRFTYYRASSAAAGMKPDDLDLNGIAAAETLHLSGITLAVSESMRETAFAAMDAARSVSLDTNLRLKLWSRDMARETLSRVIPKATHLITSLEDCQELWPVGDADQVIDMAQSMGAGTVLVTMGADGCRMAVGERRETIPAAPAS
ncbi:MAG: sugar kinase, partial [Pseudomonadota bacterium]